MSLRSTDNAKCILLRYVQMKVASRKMFLFFDVHVLLLLFLLLLLLLLLLLSLLFY